MKSNYFEEILISDNLDKAIENGICKACKEKKRKKFKNIMVSSITGLILVGGILNFNKDTFASAKYVFKDIATFLGVDSDINSYKKVIDKSISNNGYTITLNEVVLDKNELIVSSTIKSDDPDTVLEGQPLGLESIYINGERLLVNSNSVSEFRDSYTVDQVTTYFLDKDMEGDINIKIVFSGIDLLNDTPTKNIDGNWTFEFKANSDELVKDTSVVKLNKKFKLDNGEFIKLDEYISNSLGQKVTYTEEKDGTSYNTKLMGTDDLGNKVEFYSTNSNEGKGVFKLDNANGNLDEKAKSLRLSLYVNQGDESSNNWIKVGDEFNIKLLN